MLKNLPEQMRDAVLRAARGSELIAHATGETVAEVLERNLPLPMPPQTARQAMGRRKVVEIERRSA